MLIELPIIIVGAALSLALVGSDTLAAIAGPAIEPATSTLVGGVLGAALSYVLALGVRAFEAGPWRAAWLIFTIAFVLALVASLAIVASSATGLAGAVTGALAAVAAVAALVGFWQGRLKI